MIRIKGYPFKIKLVTPADCILCKAGLSREMDKLKLGECTDKMLGSGSSTQVPGTAGSSTNSGFKFMLPDPESDSKFNFSEEAEGEPGNNGSSPKRITGNFSFNKMDQYTRRKIVFATRRMGKKTPSINTEESQLTGEDAKSLVPEYDAAIADDSPLVPYASESESEV